MGTRRLLITEDDRAIGTMLVELWNDHGYDVTVAYALDQARHLATEFRPHVVLIGNDGRGNFEPGWRMAWSLAELLPQAPLVMLSTSDAAIDEVGLTERGRLFAAAMLKPFTTSRLLSIVDALCQEHAVPSSAPIEGTLRYVAGAS
jgi:DNA-binding response OmpR family regulator